MRLSAGWGQQKCQAPQGCSLQVDGWASAAALNTAHYSKLHNSIRCERHVGHRSPRPYLGPLFHCGARPESGYFSHGGYLAQAHGWGQEGHTSDRTGVRRAQLLLGFGSGGPHFWQAWGPEGHTSGRTGVQRATLLEGPGSRGPHFWQDWGPEGAFWGYF